MIIATIAQGPDKGTVYHFDEDDTLIIGRDGAIQLTDSAVSRQHAQIIYEHGQWLIRDLKSRTGTVVNGSCVLDEAELTDGSRIRIGRTMFVFTIVPIDTQRTNDEPSGLLPLGSASQSPTSEEGGTQLYGPSEELLNQINDRLDRICSDTTSEDLLNRLQDLFAEQSAPVQDGDERLEQILDRIEQLDRSSFERLKAFVVEAQVENVPSQIGEGGNGIPRELIEQLFSRIESLERSDDQRVQKLLERIDTARTEQLDEIRSLARDRNGSSSDQVLQKILNQIEVINQVSDDRLKQLMDQINCSSSGPVEQDWSADEESGNTSINQILEKVLTRLDVLEQSSNERLNQVVERVDTIYADQFAQLRAMVDQGQGIGNDKFATQILTRIEELNADHRHQLRSFAEVLQDPATEQLREELVGRLDIFQGEGENRLERLQSRMEMLNSEQITELRDLVESSQVPAQNLREQLADRLEAFQIQDQQRLDQLWQRIDSLGAEQLEAIKAIAVHTEDPDDRELIGKLAERIDTLNLGAAEQSKQVLDRLEKLNVDQGRGLDLILRQLEEQASGEILKKVEACLDLVGRDGNDRLSQILDRIELLGSDHQREHLAMVQSWEDPPFVGMLDEMQAQLESLSEARDEQIKPVIAQIEMLRGEQYQQLQLIGKTVEDGRGDDLLHEIIERVEALSMGSNERLGEVLHRFESLIKGHQEQLDAIELDADSTGGEILKKVLDEVETHNSDHRKELQEVTNSLGKLAGADHLQELANRVDMLKSESNDQASQINANIDGLRSDIRGDYMKGDLDESVREAVHAAAKEEYTLRHDQLLDTIRMLLDQQKRSDSMLQRVLSLYLPPSGQGPSVASPNTLESFRVDRTGSHKSVSMIAGMILLALLFVGLVSGGLYYGELKYFGNPSDNLIAESENVRSKIQGVYDAGRQAEFYLSEAKTQVDRMGRQVLDSESDLAVASDRILNHPGAITIH